MSLPSRRPHGRLSNRTIGATVSKQSSQMYQPVNAVRIAHDFARAVAHQSRHRRTHRAACEVLRDPRDLGARPVVGRGAVDRAPRFDRGDDSLVALFLLFDIAPYIRSLWHRLGPEFYEVAGSA